MPAQIDTVGPGKTFTTLQAWWNDVIANPGWRWAECYAGNLGLLTMGDESPGSAEENKRIYAAAGNEHNGVTGGPYVGDDGGVGATISCEFLEVIGLRFTGTVECFQFASLKKCVFDEIGLNVLSTQVVENCVATAIFKIETHESFPSAIITMRNCTAGELFGPYLEQFPATIVLQNCAAPTFDLDEIDAVSSLSLSNCLSEDGTADDYGGTGNIVAAVFTETFVDPVSSNFRVKSGSSAIDAGADLSGNGVTEDILGVTRPKGLAYDIGAFEYVAPSAILPLFWIDESLGLGI